MLAFARPAWHSERMNIEGDYATDGYAVLRGLIPPELASMLFKQIQMDLEASGKNFNAFAQKHALVENPTIELSGHFYRPLTTFLWGLTPIMSQLTGKELLPSYDHMRIYHEGDHLRVHSDRPSCEHSATLTLYYSDGKPWPIEMGTQRVSGEDSYTEDWGDEPYQSVEMQPGDAILYRGTELRHGRTQPNRNKWSAHLFLFWVERDGEFKEHAFDEVRLRSELRRVRNLDV